MAHRFWLREGYAIRTEKREIGILEIVLDSSFATPAPSMEAASTAVQLLDGAQTQICSVFK
jgi:hypothetical protein